MPASSNDLRTIRLLRSLLCKQPFLRVETMPEMWHVCHNCVNVDVRRRHDDASELYPGATVGRRRACRLWPRRPRCVPTRSGPRGGVHSAAFCRTCRTEVATMFHVIHHDSIGSTNDEA